jgi:hypothetical protein
MPGHFVTFERRRIGQGTASDQTASSHGGLVAEERPSSADSKGAPYRLEGRLRPYASRISRPCAVTAQITRTSMTITVSAQSG